MQKLILILINFIAITFINAQSPAFEWAKQIGGIGDDIEKSFDVDLSGNVYVTGCFNSTIDCDPGPGVYNLTPVGSNYNFFILKLDPNGNLLWLKQIGNTSSSFANCIKLDSQNNIYLIGSFGGTLDFNPGAGFFNLSSSNGNMFFLKLNQVGDFVFCKQTIGFPLALEIDPLDNIYTTGRFWGTSDFDFGPSIYNLNSNGLDDVFILKTDSSGGFVWANQIGGTPMEYVSSIAIDNFNNTYTIGTFSTNVDFDPSSGINNLSSNGKYSGFILKLDSLGNFVWAKQFGDTLFNLAITTDSQNNIFAVGTFSGTVDFDPGIGVHNLTSNGYAFILKLDEYGNFIWVKQLVCEVSRDRSITADNNGNIYISGGFGGTVDFDPNAGITNLTAGGASDAYILKLDGSGNLIWVKQLEGPLGTTGYSVIVDLSNNIYTMGHSSGVADFDPSVNTFNLTSYGSNDIFIQKMGQTTVNLNEERIYNTIAIYPNPNTGKLNLIISDPKFKTLAFEIYNCFGELIFKNTIDDEKNSIDLTNQVDGIYFIKVIDDNSTLFSQKIMKQ